jgi:fatty acid amide hydrolase 2
MPALRVIAGPDGVDPDTQEMELGDPSAVGVDGLEVIMSEDASLLPVARELLDVRERAAGALVAGGARVRSESMKSIRRAVEYFLATLASETETADAWTLVGGLPGTRPPLARIAGRTLRGKGDHTLSTLILLAVERLSKRMPDRRVRRAVEAGRALTDEIESVIGDGVLLHPPFPRVAPRHGRTVGRPWMLLPAAAFNLMGLPATQIPLGLNSKGLPLGVQAVAARGRDHLSIAVALRLERAFGGWVPPK